MNERKQWRERQRERKRGKKRRGSRGGETENQRQKEKTESQHFTCVHACVCARCIPHSTWIFVLSLSACVNVLSLCLCLLSFVTLHLLVMCCVCVCVCVCVCTCLCVSPRSPVYMFVCAHDLSLAVYLWTQLSFPGCVTLSTCLNFVSAVGSACVVESIAIGTFRILIKMSWFPRCVNITLHWGFSSPLFRDFFRFEYMLWVYWRCTMLAKSRRNRQTLHYHFPGSMSFQFTDL